MALDADRLGTALANAIETAAGNIDPTAAVTGAQLIVLWKAAAAALVSEFTGHAVILPTALVAPPGGGPVTGTGTIT